MDTEKELKKLLRYRNSSGDGTEFREVCDIAINAIGELRLVKKFNLYFVISRLFPNVRSSKEQRSRRNRECIICKDKIQKGEKYINHQVRYDKTILTIYMHKDCTNGL